MSRPEPTRPASLLALASALLLAACEARETERPPSAKESRASASAAAVAAPPPATAAPRVLHLPDLVPAASSAPALSREKSVRSVLVLGDSLSDETAGGGGFVRLLRDRCPGVSFDNRAKGGFMVNQMRRRLEREILPRGQAYSHAIVFGGVNDLYSDRTANRTLPRIQEDLGAIYRELKTRGASVIAITVTPWGGFKKWFTPERGQNTLTLNAWILDQAERGAVGSALDAYPLLSCGDPERLCPELAAPHKDGLHFGKLGQQRLGESLLAHLPCGR